VVVVSNLRRGRKPPGAAGRLGDPPVRHLSPYGGLPDVVAARADGIEDIRFWLLLQNAKEVDPAGGAEGIEQVLAQTPRQVPDEPEVLQSVVAVVGAIGEGALGGRAGVQRDGEIGPEDPDEREGIEVHVPLQVRPLPLQRSRIAAPRAEMHEAGLGQKQLRLAVERDGQWASRAEGHDVHRRLGESKGIEEQFNPPLLYARAVLRGVIEGAQRPRRGRSTGDAAVKQGIELHHGDVARVARNVVPVPLGHVQDDGPEVHLGQAIGGDQVEVVAWVLSGMVQIGDVDDGPRGGSGGRGLGARSNSRDRRRRQQSSLDEVAPRARAS